MADKGPEYVINKFRPGTLESEAWRKFYEHSLKSGRKVGIIKWADLEFNWSPV